VSDVSQGPGWWQASDGKWYPPQQAPTAAPPPPQPQAPPAYGQPPTPQWTPPPAKKGGNKGCLIALAVVGVVLVLGIVATVVVIAAVRDEVDDRIDVDEDGVTTFSGNDENPPADDVSVDECGPAEGTGFMRATVDVLNHSSEPSNYIITVAFESEDGDRQLTTSTALVNGLGADQTTTAETNSFQEPPNGVEFSCRISQVERFAA
jgi:hypothetical protein